MGFVYAKTVPWWADQLLPQLLIEQFDTLYKQCRHIEHMHEELWFTKSYYWQNDSYENFRQFFQVVLQWGYACSIIVHTRADQLLSQLLIEHFDTLPTQYRHIEHMHEGVWFPKKYYWQSGSYENFEIFFRLVCICMHRQCLNGPINLYQSFWWNNSILCLHNVDTLNICIKEFYSKMIIIDKMTAIGT